MKKLIFIALFALWFSAAQAHTGGFTYEAAVNNYFVDVGANKSNLFPNELILFEYNLYPTSNPNNLADFDSVYVTISDEQTGVIFSGSIHRLPDSISVMSYAFPKGGNYNMSARFDKGGTVLAETDFAIPVGTGQSGADCAKSLGANQTGTDCSASEADDKYTVRNAAKIGVLGLAVAGAVFWFWKRARKSPPHDGVTESGTP